MHERRSGGSSRRYRGAGEGRRRVVGTRDAQTRAWPSATKPVCPDLIPAAHGRQFRSCRLGPGWREPRCTQADKDVTQVKSELRVSTRSCREVLIRHHQLSALHAWCQPLCPVGEAAVARDHEQRFEAHSPGGRSQHNFANSVQMPTNVLCLHECEFAAARDDHTLLYSTASVAARRNGAERVHRHDDRRAHSAGRQHDHRKECGIPLHRS